MTMSLDKGTCGETTRIETQINELLRIFKQAKVADFKLTFSPGGHIQEFQVKFGRIKSKPSALPVMPDMPKEPTEDELLFASAGENPNDPSEPIQE